MEFEHKLTSLQKYWLLIAEKKNLKVEAPFTLQFIDGKYLTVEVLLHGYGAEKGMLIVSDYSIVKPYTSEINKLGYGFSCMFPSLKEGVEADEVIDEILNDWKKQ